MARKQRAGKASPQELADLEAYQAQRGKPGRPRRGGGEGAPPPAAPPPAPPSSSETPPPVDQAGGGSAPPLVVDLGDIAGTPPPAPGEAPAAAGPDPLAEKQAMANMGAALVVEMMRKCRPVIEEAKLPVPPLPEFLMPVVEKAWQVTLMKWLPDDVGNVDEHAEFVACGTTAYQLGLAYGARRKLAERAAKQLKVQPANTNAPPEEPPPAVVAPTPDDDLPVMRPSFRVV